MDGSGLVLMEVISVFIVMLSRRALCSRRLRRMRIMMKMSLLLKSLWNKRLVASTIACHHKQQMFRGINWQLLVNL